MVGMACAGGERGEKEEGGAGDVILLSGEGRAFAAAEMWVVCLMPRDMEGWVQLQRPNSEKDCFPL
jgi:hypothetical protein